MRSDFGLVDRCTPVMEGTSTRFSDVLRLRHLRVIFLKHFVRYFLWDGSTRSSQEGIIVLQWEKRVHVLTTEHKAGGSDNEVCRVDKQRCTES